MNENLFNGKIIVLNFTT